MPEITELSISTLSEYGNFVGSQPDTLWYRGCGDSSYTLIPSLYRHPKIKNSDELFKQEFDILKRFRQRSVPYTHSSLTEKDHLTTLFFMQHYGVPTRLLDWTENPYIALYFALSDTDYEKTQDGPTYQTDAAVWILNPAEWNKKAFNYEISPGIISPPDNEALNGHLPTANPRLGKPEPIALYGIHNSPRIVAQRGAFALFGTKIEPMEEAYRTNEYPQDCLRKLVIDKGNIKSVLDALGRIGITDSAVFPDLSGLAKEIKRQFGFWV